MAMFSLLKIDNFAPVRSISPREISTQTIEAVKDLDERDEIEPWIQAILDDTNHTPHGPSEIVDIFSHKMTVRGQEGVSAFILKGKSFPTVRPAHVSHQILRLHRINDLAFAVLAASGNILDEVKEAFLTTVASIGCDYCFMDAADLARLFVAFGHLCLRDGNRLVGGRCSCGYTPNARTSNLLQIEALRELAASHEMRDSAGAVVLPTGAGKTRVAALDIRRYDPECCIYVAHRHEILEDAEAEFLREFPRESVRRFQGRPDAALLRKINLITIQSLSRNLDVLRGVNVSYLVVDEVHHAAARSYRSVVAALSPQFLLGLTATPFRGDRQDVLEICNNNVIVYYELREGIELGILCPYHYYGCFDDIDYTHISHNGRNYDLRDLERALIIPERDAAVFAKWIEKADGKPTLAFCCSHVHAKRVAASFSNWGICAEPYLSTTSGNRRAALREQFRTGETKVLCVVDVLNEGVDLPFAECLLFLRPTESKRIFYQQLGRGLRHYFGKDLCVVIDFIGNFRNAYKIVEYQGLDSIEETDSSPSTTLTRNSKETLNLPLGCRVEFDERVIDIFGQQTLDPRYASRHNIGRILIHQYRKLERLLGHPPTKQQIDRMCLLNSSLYEAVFGSWKAFQSQVSSDTERH